MARITRDNLLRSTRTQSAADAVPDDGLTPDEWAKLPINPWTRYNGLLLFGGLTGEQLRGHAMWLATLATDRAFFTPVELLDLARAGVSTDDLAGLVRWTQYDAAMRAVISTTYEDPTEAAYQTALHVVTAVGGWVLDRAIVSLAARCSDGQA